MEFLVVVHCGAGVYSDESREKLVKLTKRLCKSITAERNLDSPTVICRRGILHLENSPLTNAGLGANLTDEGRVECDACLMQGRDLLFAAVGAMSGVKNPIDVPFAMLEKRAEDLLHGSPLVFPLSICGDGAKKLALKYNIDIVEEKSLITRASFNRYKKCLKKMNGSKHVEEIDRPDAMSSFLKASAPSDTVGCLALNSSGCTAAACSSGGVLFKKSGRLGPAASYGCACWAEDADDFSITITVSGCGETLIKTHFAQSCAEFILQKLRQDENSCLMDIVQDFFKIHYLESRLLSEFDICRKTAGFIVVVCQKCKTNIDTENNIFDLLIELAYVHNSDEMLIGYGLRRKDGETKLQSFCSKSDNGKVISGGFLIK